MIDGRGSPRLHRLHRPAHEGGVAVDLRRGSIRRCSAGTHVAVLGDSLVELPCLACTACRLRGSTLSRLQGRVLGLAARVKRMMHDGEERNGALGVKVTP